MHVCVRRGPLYMGTRHADFDHIQLRYVKALDHALLYPKQFRDTVGLQAFADMDKACFVLAEDIDCEPEGASIL